MQLNSLLSRHHRIRDSAEKGVWCTARDAFAAVLLMSVLTATAADAPPRAASAEAPPMSAELIRPGLYRINGAGGGTLLRLSSKRLIVVDSNRAGTYRPLMVEIQRNPKTAELPLSMLILTAVGPEQAGNVAQFAADGVPVVVQQRAVARLIGAAPASGAAALGPLVTYDTDYPASVDDIVAEVEHVGRGRTGADSVVLFRDLRVMAVGELFTHGTPEPDCASGGSFAGWAAAIAHFFWLDFDLVVPSRGAAVGKAELAAFKATLEALAAREGSSPSGPSCRPQT